MPSKGLIVLWLLAILLPAISLIELAEIVRHRRIDDSAAG